MKYKTFLIYFEHSKYGTKIYAGVTARNMICAIVKAAKQLGLKSKFKNDFWDFWHEDNGINCYLLCGIH